MLKVMRYAILLQFQKGYGRKWELITNTAEFVDPANVIFFRREQENKKKIIINK